jgi:lipoprotein-anchoring transpeptidase ErfK/SrfK
VLLAKTGLRCRQLTPGAHEPQLRENLGKLHPIERALLRIRAHSTKINMAAVPPGAAGRGFAIGILQMRARMLLSATLFAAVVASLAFAPKAAQAHGALVAVPSSFSAGTIVIRTSERRLYYVLGGGRALAYPVGVGRAGKQWSGTSYINGKYIRPDWSPPDVVRADHPGLPKVIKGGSPANPMGAAAMLLSGGEYAIHGTNQPGSIGHFVSYGCIRMFNEDIKDLYERVSVGTEVIVQ